MEYGIYDTKIQFCDHKNHEKNIVGIHNSSETLIFLLVSVPSDEEFSAHSDSFFLQICIGIDQSLLSNYDTHCIFFYDI